MENMRKIINIQAGKPVLVEPKNNIKTVKGHNRSSIKKILQVSIGNDDIVASFMCVSTT